MMLTIHDENILDVIEMPVSQIGMNGNPTAGSNRDCLKAVYQIFHKKDRDSIGDNIIHDKIGYTGSSKDAWYRTVAIRQPKGSHSCGVYLRNLDSNLDDIIIRYLCLDEDLTPKQIKGIENKIQKATKEKFGAAYAWDGASGGNSGKKDRIMSMLDFDLSRDDMLEIKDKLYSLYIEKVVDEAEQSWSV